MKKRKNKWYYDSAAYHEVVLSGSVTLARNLADFDFPAKMSEEDAAEVVSRVRGITTELAAREGREYYSCRVDKLSNTEKDCLIESHTITPSLKRRKDPSGLIISEDESISIMVNEDDHIHIQAIKAGYNLREAYKTANRIDDYIDSVMPYCFSEKYGYLTSKLQDAGTGMHASYMLSLPGITMGGKVDALQEDTGWSEATVYMMLRRMVEKNILSMDPTGRYQTYRPLLKREDAVIKETRNFLDRVYQGSLRRMLIAMTGQKELSKEELDELWTLRDHERKKENGIQADKKGGSV